jgi:sulfatase maturation enzyme AslB (radical SAM superfamily)
MNDKFIKIHDELPVFKIDHNQSKIVYTPGLYIVLDNTSDQWLTQQIKDPYRIADKKMQIAVLNLLDAAKRNVNGWENLKINNFSPECLTIHVGAECNFDCEYCYSRIRNGNKLVGFPKLEDIKSAFNYLAENSPDTTKPVTIVFHGSGEPTLHWEKLKEAHSWLSETAKHLGLNLFYYLATNGSLNKDQVAWIAWNIDQVGISCDGPPEIQQKQRSKSVITNLQLEEVCRILRMNGTLNDIRVTITPQTISKQLAIVQYIIDRLQAKRIRIEPVYLYEYGFKSEHALDFFDNYISAKNYAEEKGVSLEYSGIRLQELHGSFCDVSRNTMRLTPEGCFRNCFCRFQDDDGFILGDISMHSKVFMNDAITDIKQKAFNIPAECFKCINVYHCSRGCPDFCIYTDQGISPLDSFKCRLNQLIAVDLIKKMAEKHLRENE